MSSLIAPGRSPDSPPPAGLDARLQLHLQVEFNSRLYRYLTTASLSRPRLAERLRVPEEVLDAGLEVLGQGLLLHYRIAQEIGCAPGVLLPAVPPALVPRGKR